MSSHDRGDTAGIPFPPPMAFLTALAFGFGLQRFIPVHLSHTLRGIDALEWIGAGLVFCGVAVAVSALACFRAVRTSPLPERPSTSLVVRGPFRFSRNPLYVSMSLICAGVSLFANALWPLLLLIPALIAIRYLVIAREERYLLRQFGAQYEEYFRRVRRWL